MCSILVCVYVCCKYTWVSSLQLSKMHFSTEGDINHFLSKNFYSTLSAACLFFISINGISSYLAKAISHLVSWAMRSLSKAVYLTRTSKIFSRSLIMLEKSASWGNIVQKSNSSFCSVFTHLTFWTNCFLSYTREMTELHS